MDLQTIKKHKTTEELLEFSIINVDKPSGPTSFQTDEKIKKWLKLKKAAHFGTLDPKVTGVLPVSLNRACKLSDYFMHKDKTYAGVMHLHKKTTKKKLEKEMKKFIGKIKQTPPKKSKVKRQERQRTIKKFEIIEIKGQDVLFLSKVQAGTYIRKLIHDLGENIGGAHMLELRRTQAGIFSEENTHTLYEVKKAIEEYKKGNEQPLRQLLIPAEIISEILPVVECKQESVTELLRGRPIYPKDLTTEEIPEKFVIFSGNKFIEVARKSEEVGIVARPEFVFN
jgi:H/ACA ribonucleoprotein complex subunit 4